MDRSLMRLHAPAAKPIGVASLANHRFVITADGYASVAPARAQAVYGVLWRMTPRDRVTLEAWENITGGLYRADAFSVRQAGRRHHALVYVARRRQTGWPKIGYMEIVIAAARAWKLPPAYIASLRRWLPSHPPGGGSRRLEEFEWT